MYNREMLGVGCVYAVLRVEWIQLLGKQNSENNDLRFENIGTENDDSRVMAPTTTATRTHMMTCSTIDLDNITNIPIQSRNTLLSSLLSTQQSRSTTRHDQNSIPDKDELL
jgi:hypothetical protein